MKKMLLVLLVFIFSFVILGLNLPKALSDELDDINKEINELTNALNQSKAATTPLEAQLKDIQARVNIIEQEIPLKKRSIDEGYAKLAKQQNILNTTIRNYYIKSYYNSPILIFLSSNDASTITQVLAYQKATADQDKAIITNIALSILDLENKKRDLETEQNKLATIKINLDKIVSDAKKYQQELTGKIAELSARQQEIINARSGTFTATIGDSELADDYNASIKGFREQAPSSYFAIFAFGAHTHRKGMSQYGARGRAQSNQDYKTILKAYYGKEPVDKDTGGTIKVAGFGEMDFEGRY
ncbi:MAG: hypothetical protein HYT09_02630, partial [Candidatus Levybacteria bacterium]|nr:hypothetical protein [Candidatus Levybacteria bacterium]